MSDLSLSLTFFSFSFVSARSRNDWWYALLVFCTVDSSMSQTYCLGGLGEEGGRRGEKERGGGKERGEGEGGRRGGKERGEEGGARDQRRRKRRGKRGGRLSSAGIYLSLQKSRLIHHGMSSSYLVNWGITSGVNSQLMTAIESIICMRISLSTTRVCSWKIQSV